jgi:molybdopterin synthase catalytic subunit/molybdopterin converting factor small subunit
MERTEVADADINTEGQVLEIGARYTGDATASLLTGTQMKIRVLFFGVLKDLFGRSLESIDLADGMCVRDVIFYYARKAPVFEAMMPSLAISVNQEYSGGDRPLHEGDEVGLLPPVSGGSPGGGSGTGGDDVMDGGQGRVQNKVHNEVRIVRERIDAEVVVARLQQPEDGALVIFSGVVRNSTRERRTLYLDYDAYEAMALKQMESLAVEARTRFEVREVSIVHRLGRLEIGETSVLIVVAAAHRAAAFEACRWIIDTLKKTVPIWKKEHFEDGAVWADGEAFPEEIRRPGSTAGTQSAS